MTISSKVAGHFWKLHNEKLRDLYFLPNVTLVIKSCGMKWAKNVEGMGERRVAARF